MKKIGILSVMAMLLLAVGVSATAFVVDKDVLVTGDYVWNSGWTLPDPKPVTAWYNFDASSPLATTGTGTGYIETETMGEAWKYKLDMAVGANMPGITHSVFDAITVNDPATTPSVDFTAYRFVSDSMGDFSNSHLSVSGIGEVHVDVKTIFDTAFQQMNQVRVNE